jgi:hypothetical protein
MNHYIVVWVANYIDTCVKKYLVLKRINVKKIYTTAAKIMVDLEEKYIDKMFEMGDIENLKSYDLKTVY